MGQFIWRYVCGIDETHGRKEHAPPVVALALTDDHPQRFVIARWQAELTVIFHGEIEMSILHRHALAAAFFVQDQLRLLLDVRQVALDDLAAVLDQPKGGFCSGGEPAKHLYAGGFAKPWDDL